MRVTVLGAVVALVVIALTAAPASRAQEPVDGAGLEREVRALNTTLSELVELLRRQLESSNAAVLMQRVQLMTARIAPLEEELRSSRSERQGLENNLNEIELSVASFEAQLEREVEEEKITAEHARNLLEQQRPPLEQRKKQLGDQLWTVQQRVIDLEQRLDRRRTEIETWEGEIDRALGLR